jgi:hypothetical protein
MVCSGRTGFSWVHNISVWMLGLLNYHQLLSIVIRLGYLGIMPYYLLWFPPSIYIITL